MDSFVYPDYYGEKNEGFPEYTVRSIYFDSFQRSAYQEKVDGIKERKKLRIRAYDDYYQGCKVFLEIKRKVEYMVIKNRSLVPFDQLEHILLFGNIDDYFPPKEKKQIEDGIKFLYHLKKNNLKPENLVVYDREAYFGKFNRDVRITFDKNIRSKNKPLLEDLFSEANLKPIWKNKFILEIKYFTGVMPIWARSIVQEFKLKNESLSKYVQGVEET